MKLARFLTVLSLAALMLIAAIVPAAAQDVTANYPVNTITVTGTGSAAGAPDVAYLQLGVDTIDPDLKTAFTTTNDNINAVIEALVGAGIDRADIRTVGFNIYQDRQPMGADGTEFSIRYSVSNLLRVTVRDIATVADVINVGIESGANALYGLEFSINDRAALESEARASAMDDAKARAAELAQLAGVELGNIVIVSETTGGGFPQFDLANGRAGGGAAIEPGQLSVNISLNVTFQISR
jgi:uncharacterized protein